MLKIGDCLLRITPANNIIKALPVGVQDEPYILAIDGHVAIVSIDGEIPIPMELNVLERNYIVVDNVPVDE